jgi:TolA-binding protein
VGAEALYQQGLLHFRRKEYDQAAEAFRLLSTKYPTDERAGAVALQAAWAAHNAGLFAETLRYAQRALTEGVTPERAEWLYLKANAERQLMKHDAAVASYTELLQRHPDSDLVNPARYETALTLYRMGRFRDALRAVEAVHATAKLKKDVYWLRAESHAALGEDDHAVQYYQLITREFPSSDVAQDAGYRLAHHLQGKGDFQEAARQFSAVAVNFPNGEMAPQALFASAYCLERAGQHAEAARDLATLVEKYPTSKPVEEALYMKAMNEVRLTRDDSATLSLNELLKRFPGSRFTADALYWKGVFAAKKGRPADAEVELRKALEREPRPELVREIKLQLALVLRETGEKARAADLLDELVASPMRSRLPEALLRWTAETWFEQGENRKSLAAASALADRATTPDWKQTAHGMEGRCLMAMGKPKEAAEAFRKAVATGGKTRFAAEANLRLGDLASEARELTEAHKYYSDAARGASDDSQIAVRAHAYAGLGQTALAQRKIEEAARYFLSVAILFDDAELVPKSLYEAAEAFRALDRPDDRAKTIRELKERFPASRYVKELSGEGAGAGGEATAPGTSREAVR